MVAIAPGAYTDAMDDPQFPPTPPTRPRAPTRVTLVLPADVADALILRAARNFRRPRDEAVAVIVEQLRLSGELPR